MLGLPAQCALEFVLAGDEDGGVAGAARRKFARNLAASNALGGVEDFEDGEAPAVAYIEGFAGDGLYRF